MNELQIIPDGARLAELRVRITPLLDPPADLSRDELRRRGWMAVPVEKGRHLEPEDAPRLAAAMLACSSGPFIALPTEPTGVSLPSFSIPPDADGLILFSRECAGLNYVVASAVPGFALLFTSEDYNLYAGTKPFLQAVLGRNIADARAAFACYARDPCWDGRMLEVHQRYNDPD